MAINLHDKYAKQLELAFTRPSYLDGAVSNRYDWQGVKTIKTTSILTQAMNDYARTGMSRYGDPKDLEDTNQELSITQDKSFSIIVDKGDNTEQDMLKNAGEVIKAQMNEQAVPLADKYAFAQFARHAGHIAGVAKPDKGTIIGAVLDGLQYLDENLVPDDGRTVWATPEMSRFIAQSTEYMSLQALGAKAIGKGDLGMIQGARLRKVLGSRLPDGCYFLITHKSAVLFPKKLWDTNIHQDPPGISGHLLEGRCLYDAFVLGTKCAGVYACVDSSLKQAEPTITVNNRTFTIPDAEDVRYTTDGTDPRYSTTAQAYTEPVTVPAGKTMTMKAVALTTAARYMSNLAEATIGA